MSDLAGTGGNFTSFTGFNAHFSAWAAQLVPTLVENTGFAENGNRTSIPTAQMWTGSAVGTGTTSTAFPAGLTGSNPTYVSYTGTVTLQSYSGITISFNANVSGLALNRAQDGKVDYALSFQSSGPIAAGGYS